MRPFSVLLFLVSLTVHAQTPLVLWPGTTYDPNIPTQQKIFGRAPGDRISSPAEILTYLRSLQAAAPKQMKLVPYGKTWEGRELVYVVIGSEENIAKLEQLQAAVHQIADPRKTSATQAKQLSANLPAIVWLAYGVHGNEISSPDAALVTAYHLLAARDDKLTDQILADDLILLDPLQNPDGRNRFVQNFETAEGLVPDPDQSAAEHNEPWPGGRTNHYLFDMNRDWFAMTQPETLGRIAAVRNWLPLVFVDLHEMGSDSTYYFAPEANPYNPYITGVQKDSLEWFGKNNARYFDGLGYSYFTKEGYDEFYPGYGASWPLYYGGIGMTYEQASTRGLTVKKSDGTTVDYRDTVKRHFITSISTLETAATHRQELWDNFYRYRSEAVAAGQAGKLREYVLPREGNVSAVDKLAAHLADQGIEVKRATEPFTNASRTFPQGSYCIPLAQPSYRLIRALLDPQVSMDPKFLQAEESRRAAKQPSEMYDVTAWSLPLQYGITAVGVDTLSAGKFETVPQHFTRVGSINGSGQVAYLIPWGTTGAGKFLVGALRAGIRVSTTDREFVQNGRRFPSGTLVIKVKENRDGTAELVRQLAAQTGIDATATDTGWMDEGPNFGSRHMAAIPSDLKIAIAWDRPTASSAAGAARYVIEREFGYPVTAIRASQLSSADLTRFKVLVLPDSLTESYDTAISAPAMRRIHDWISAGGTLVALGPGATASLTTGRAGLLATQQENAARGDGEKDKSKDDSPTPPTASTTAQASTRVAGKLIRSDAEYRKTVQGDGELPDSLHGVLLRAHVDSRNWISAGVPETVNVMVTGRAIFAPLHENRGANASYFENADKLLASGFLWEPNRLQLAYKPFVIVQREGRGNIVAFTADPTFRGYMDGLNVLLLNALFRGPAHIGSAGAGDSEE